MPIFCVHLYSTEIVHIIIKGSTKFNTWNPLGGTRHSSSGEIGKIYEQILLQLIAYGAQI